MPGSGKSTIGFMLARMTERNFLDTDLIIQKSKGRLLQDIVNIEGYLALRQIEEDILKSLKCVNHVIATGGSAVYSHSAMNYLKLHGTIVFLNADLPTLELRIHHFNTRGLAKRPDQGLPELFEERLKLYKKYADIIIECANLRPEEVCFKIIMEHKAYSRLE